LSVDAAPPPRNTVHLGTIGPNDCRSTIVAALISLCPSRHLTWKPVTAAPPCRVAAGSPGRYPPPRTALSCLYIAPGPPHRPSPHHRAPTTLPCSTTTICTAAANLHRSPFLAAEPRPQAVPDQGRAGIGSPHPPLRFPLSPAATDPRGAAATVGRGRPASIPCSESRERKGMAVLPRAP
jgi:hypothetical protein